MTASDTPMPDLDRLSAEEVAARAEDLSPAQVDALIIAEEQGGRRMPVLQALYARREGMAEGATSSPMEPSELAADPGRTPDDGVSQGPRTAMPTPQPTEDPTPPRT
jgi:hypothetical protein